ncbi:peptidoglycan DD-metalloendopeptidase family protein, partial [Phosphitispora fastidiosa]|uniref:peptidoglycan DD-metalloendopeptidase family protein n=1 Tax=Phosphitispora fastidiosa TaxID=2837202 RepID=UPI001E5BB371
MKSNNMKLAALFDVVKNSIDTAFQRLRSRKITLTDVVTRLANNHASRTKALKQKYHQLKESRNSAVQNSVLQKNNTPLKNITQNRLLQFVSGLRPTEISLAHFFNNRNRFNLKTAAIAVFVLISGGVFVYEFSAVPAYAVLIDGKNISYVSDRAEAEKLLSSMKKAKTAEWKRRVDLTQTVTFKDTEAKRYQVDEAAELKSIFDQKLNFVAVATAIKADGQTVAVVHDEKDAEGILQELRGSYSNGDIKVGNIGFKEKIEMVNIPVSLNDVMSREEALQLITEGKEEKKVHVVEEGDSLWTIARKNDTHVEDLLKANPSLDGEHLDIGQELNLVAIEPLINVEATGELTLEETVPFKVVVETNKDLWRGSQKVKTNGENGLKEVTYKVVMRNGDIVSKEVLQEKVLKEAKDKVVIKGSRVVVASRGGSGTLGWPIRGQITSRYGKRGSGTHTGLDINGTTGQPVGAAESGKVTSAGWQGSYGKMVTLRHSNGLVTRYAHLSSIKVSVGQEVGRGDLIGLVGSTGRSTGSHLH